MSEQISHIGMPRRSGRYPWGSGGEYTKAVNKMASEGFTEKEIAKALGISTTVLRNQKALAKAEEKEAMRLNVIRQKERGMSIAAISREFNIPPSTVSDLLKPGANLKFKIIQSISNVLRKIIGEKRFVDVGDGAEVFMEVPRPKLDNAITNLRNEGYKLYYLKQENLQAPGKIMTVKVLGAPDTTMGELLASRADIAIPNYVSKDRGLTFFEPSDIKNVSSDKVLVKYAEDGGADKDGLIEMRAGIPEYSLGGKRYAQVRIGVDGTHYMKGMVVMRDDLPKGVDFIYNVSKERPPDGNKLAALKEQKTEDDGSYSASQFGAIVKPNEFIGSDGKLQTGPINIVGGETPGSLSIEGYWSGWRKNLSSQVLSKQSPRLAKEQLDIIEKNAEAELNDILSLTHPVVRNHLLMEFSDKMDRASVDLQAAALPRQATHVLLPDPNLKENEVYAPNYDNGETVALVRYPHGGKFEIPTLTVNNKTSEYRDLIGADAQDAVAVNPKVAHKLSGADFDGDTVLVIPNGKKKIDTQPSLTELKDFDPRTTYKIPDDLKFDPVKNPAGIKPITDTQKQLLMGKVSNLITDMTIKGASQNEIARAVRHSMVVIDAEKHELNVKQSELDHNIPQLKERYQGGKRKGASTLISLAGSELRVPARKDYFTIDPISGEKIYATTDEVYISKKTGKETPRMMKTTKGEFYGPEKLSSGTAIEKVYVEHSNKLRDYANKARLATLDSPEPIYSQKARNTYKTEVNELNAMYTTAVMHRPINRKVQLLGGQIYKNKIDKTPNMSVAEKKKWKGRSYQLAQARLDAAKPKIKITPRQWEAIEMGAVSNTRLKGILRNADMDQVRKYATPRSIASGLSTGKVSRAKALLAGGYTNAEVAQALGVPVSQVRDIDRD